MELRRREHARSVSLRICQLDEVATHHERCEFIGGRDDLPDGCEVFGGLAGDLEAPEPEWPVDQQDLEGRLRRFTVWIGGEVELTYRAVATGRTFLAGDGPPTSRTRTVFSLTGTAATVPIGISGSGNGFATLANQELAETIAWTRSAVAAAAAPVSGRGPAVLSPQAAAVLLHEAVGHYAEAMHVGAPAVHRLYTRIADCCLSVVDEPEPRQPDDEGVRTLGPTEIVHNGVLIAQLHNRATARAAATAPTGNARAAQVWDPPIPRMSNLVCAPGKRPEPALINEIGAGVYIHRVADGYRQGTRVSARVVLGEHIHRGRRTGRYFTGSHVDGRLDLLTELVELGNHAERNPNAMCGKDGQLLFDVGTVAPAMRLASLRLTS